MRIRKTLFSFIVASLFVFGSASVNLAHAQKLSPSPSASASPSASPTAEPTAEPTPRPDITQKTEESVGPLEDILNHQQLGPALPFNPIKYAIRGAVSAGIPANTIVLLLLLPVVATVIAATRHIVGLRGFGIFLPAALSVAFLALGPLAGIFLFLVIIFTSTLARIVLRKLKIKMQYLPRMALILWIVVLGVLGVLFAYPVLPVPDIANVSIFPVLILVLLAEEFSKIQLGKSARTAMSQATETIILSLVSFIFLTLQSLQSFALLNPELLLISVAVIDILIGKYVGLRFLEYWRFRKLIKS